MKKEIIAIIFLCSSLSVVAEDKIDYAEYYGVDLPAKPAEKTPETQSEPSVENVVVPGFKKELSEDNTGYIRVKNEYPESMKICFENAFDKIEIYLNAYEENSKVPLNTKFDYKVKVFNVYNQYLGYINKPNIKSGLVKISPFLLLQEIPKKTVTVAPAVKEETKQLVEAGQRAETNPEPAAESPTAEIGWQKIIPENVKPKPEPKSALASVADAIADVKFKNEFEAVEKQNKIQRHPIKIANLSRVSVHLDIIDAKDGPIGSGWTITPEVSEPEFLNFAQERIEISEDALLELSPVADSSLKLNKKPQDLDLDSQGNYLWLIK